MNGKVSYLSNARRKKRKKPKTFPSKIKDNYEKETLEKNELSYLWCMPLTAELLMWFSISFI